MKHAIMVIGHGSSDVLQETISILDDKLIDFYILWDEKYDLPKLSSNYSQIIFVPRIKIYWGTDSQVRAEKILFDFVDNQDLVYDYVHLISSSDIPLMDKHYFKHFFKQDVYISYVENVTDKIKDRIRFYYLFQTLSPSNSLVRYTLYKPIGLINRFLKINKAKNINIEKGANWFSIRGTFLHEICAYPHFSAFLHSFCADELYVQSVLNRFKTSKKGQSLNLSSARYIDWNRGKPYVFSKWDIDELRSRINTNYAFARKVQDASVPKELFK